MSDFYRWFVDPATPTQADVDALEQRDAASREAAQRQAAVAAWRQRHPEATCSDAVAWELIAFARMVGREL